MPLAGRDPARRRRNPHLRTLTVPGLHQPVEIIRDHFGIAHIYAKNEHDLFFAQGYNVARDRLFQLEMWRRQATGTVAEILGQKELKRDIGNRLFLYRGDLTKELNWYHPHGAAIIDAFVEGINAYIDQTARDPELLTPEFKMLGIAPGKWTPAVVISRFNGLLGNLDSEMNMALAVKTLGADKVKDLDYFQPANPDLRIDPAIDASLLSKDILEVFDAFRTPLKFTADELPPEYRNPKSVARLETPSIAPSAAGPERAARRYRQQQLGGERAADQERLSAPDERSAPRPGSAVAALLGASERAGLECDRRGRAVAARRFHRP